MAFTDRDVVEFLGDPVIFDRALVYFNQGRVLSLSASASGIEGDIRGSGGSRYHAYVTFSHGELRGGCSCPYPLLCKHLGALLLAAIRKEAIPDSWGHAERCADPTALGRRDLTLDRGDSHYLSILDIEPQEYKTRLLPEGESPKPGSRVLYLTVVAESIYAGSGGRRLQVTPLARYIRRDGSAGALSPWRPGTECVAYSSGEMELLPELNQREGRKIPLNRILFARALGGEMPRLWVTVPREDTRDPPVLSELEFARLERVFISFFPVRFTGDRVLFQPCLAIKTASGERYPLDEKLEEGLRRWIESGKRRFLVERRIDLLRAALGRWGGHLPEEEDYWLGVEDGVALLLDRNRGRLFWSSRRVHGRLLRELDPEKEREFSYPDLLRLREYLRRQDPTGSVELRLPPKEAEVVELSPQLVVGIEDGAVSLSFDLPGRSSEEIPETDHLILDFYDNDKAERELQPLADLCMDLLTPLNPGKSWDGQVICDGCVAEIVEAIAEPMVEAGARVEVAGRPVRTGKLSFALRVTSSGEDWFSLRLTTTVEGEVVHVSDDGTLGYAPDGSIIVARNREELERLKKRLNLSDEGTMRIEEGEFHRLADLEGLIREEEENRSEAAKRAAELIRRARERQEAWLRLTKQRDDVDRDAPPGFGTILRPYQRRGFGWLREVTGAGFGALLADDMGLGKTVQALALLQEHATSWVSSAAGVQPVSLVVAPPATIENWRHEVLSFAPALFPLVYHGPSRMELLNDLASTDAVQTRDRAPVLITSYQTLLKDAQPLSEVEWDHIIFDEVQQIKNAKTKSHRAARKLRAKHLFALSGTPVENSSLELHAVMDLLNPGILGNRSSFLRRFGTPIERDGDGDARRRLRDLLAPLILRRRKADVAKDLPPRDEIPLYVSLPPFQRTIYEQLRSEYRERIRDAMNDSEPGKRLFLILEGLTRLRQAAVDPGLLPSNLRRSGGEGGGRHRESAKLAAFTELVTRITGEGHRVLVFSQFVSLLTILREWAERSGYDCCYLDGSMSPARRKREIARFQESQGPPLFLISLRAGGVGINLTAADYVILMDPWWNPAVEDQAIDRSHRIGQTRPVTAYRIIASETVEERIAALQSRKRALAGDIVPDESTIVSSLSSDEILELFAP